MSINFSQTQECAGKLDLMRVGKMSVHQWIIRGVLIHWCTLSTPTHNTFTHNMHKCLFIQLKYSLIHRLYFLLSLELDKLHSKFECEIIDHAVIEEKAGSCEYN